MILVAESQIYEFIVGFASSCLTAIFVKKSFSFYSKQRKVDAESLVGTILSIITLSVSFLMGAL